MADAIQWSLPLGNGAVILHYNEVVYSFPPNTIRDLTSYTYDIMIAINLKAINPFIFSYEAYTQYSSNNLDIAGISQAGNTIDICTLNYQAVRYRTYSQNHTTIFLLR